MSPEAAAVQPTDIRQAGADKLAITWSDGAQSELAVRTLRLACRCAHCVDEWTGAERLEPDSVPEDVRPVQIAPVGRYGIRIEWSDGHSAGIYSFRRLRELGEAG
jgi:ATP-binding protein involved in chromosome partitioning